MPVAVRISSDNDKKEIAALTLRQKFRNHYRKGPTDKSASFARALFIYQATTQLYVSLRYLIPHAFSHYDARIQYAIQAITCFLAANAVSNWLCLILCTSKVQRKTVESKQMSTPLQNGQLDRLPSGEDDLPWKYCSKCDMAIPPRAHHCDVCNVCVLKKDHHCYLTGVCIGFHNQRYFVVLTFYTALTGCISWYLTASYLRSTYWTAISGIDILPPFAFFHYITGVIEHHVFLMLTHIFMLTIFAPIGFMYFCGQICLIAQDMTMHEFKKKIKIKSSNSLNSCFKSVFGAPCGLNFLFPATIICGQYGDGYHWDGVKIQKDYDFKFHEIDRV